MHTEFEVGATCLVLLIEDYTDYLDVSKDELIDSRDYVYDLTNANLTILQLSRLTSCEVKQKVVVCSAMPLLPMKLVLNQVRQQPIRATSFIRRSGVPLEREKVLRVIGSAVA